MKKITFLFFILTVNLNFCQLPNYVPTDGLIGFWPFNGNANDESGNGNNGTVNGATLTTVRYGNTNNAFDFNGFSNYITVPNDPVLNSPNKTISVWLNFDTEPTNITSGAMGLITKWYQITNCNNTLNDAFGLVLGKSDNLNRFFGATNLYSQSTLFTNITISANIWYNVVFTHDSSSGGKIYVNGVLISNNNVTGNICSNQNNLIFGADNNQGNLFRLFNGKIDDIGIWNRALTYSEVLNLFNSTLSNNNFDNNTKIDIYPNPVNEILNLDLSNNELIERLSIYDVTGKTVLEIKDISNHQINVSSLEKGVYIIDIKTQIGSFKEKFVKN